MSEEIVDYHNALPLKSMLHEYRLDSVLGAGGFGITYLGWDTNLEKHVAIKEFMPGELAMRALDGSVVPVNTDNEHDYHWGLDRFMQEARTLAKFSHPNIVRVNRYFEANGTSYMVMEYEAGESLHQLLKRAPMPDEATLTAIVMPILDGLQAVHNAGFLHRDIKPSNVFIRKDGTPVLLDFGSSRFAAGTVPKTLTAIVSPGYAPLEQYSGDGNQGPWSDIYGLACVLFRAVTGENPPDAVRRLKADTVRSSLMAARTRFCERLLNAIERGMNCDERLRPQSVSEWREHFRGGPPATAMIGAAQARADPTQRVSGTPRPTAATVAGAGTQRASKGGAEHTSSVRGADWSAPASGTWMRRGAIVLIAAVAVYLYLRPRTVEQEPLRAAQPPAVETSAPARAPVPADEPPAPAAPDVFRGGEIPPALMKEFIVADLNGDGYLTPNEVRGRFPVVERDFSSVDADGDGRISPRELWQLRRNQRASKQKR